MKLLVAVMLVWGLFVIPVVSWRCFQARAWGPLAVFWVVGVAVPVAFVGLFLPLARVDAVFFFAMIGGGAVLLSLVTSGYLWNQARIAEETAGLKGSSHEPPKGTVRITEEDFIDESTFRLRCPCGTTATVGTALLGKTIRCKQCSALLTPRTTT